MCSIWSRAAFSGSLLGGEQLVQHLGAAEDDAERILQIVRDGAEHFALEGVGASSAARSGSPAAPWRPCSCAVRRATFSSSRWLARSSSS